MHKGKAKPPRKEVIDEDSPIDETELNENPTEDTEELQKTLEKLNPTAKNLGKTLTDISKIELEEDEPKDKELDSQTINGITNKYNNIYKKQGNVTNQDMEGIAGQYPFDKKSSILDYLDGYDPGLEFDI